ncbi:hypothetical protein [Demequina pelophila]|uniref:hypothetical protein n=1 Tax=Demequina pelophila TaxID=1638984 RepID=UPI0007828FB3|nr:hypothetical protein [Demequina pelophila]
MRFAILWVAAGVALVGAMVVFFYEVGVLEEAVAGTMEGEPITTGDSLFMAGMAVFPLAVAVAAVFVRGRANAITNLVGGVLLGAFGVFAVVSEGLVGDFHTHVIAGAAAGAIAWLIAGLSIVALRRHSLDKAPPGSVRLEFTATARP